MSTAETESTAEPAPAAVGPDGTDLPPAPDADSDDLEGLRGRPLAEHAAGYERIHQQLQATLAAIDTA